MSLWGRDLNRVIHTKRITTASCDALEQRVAFLNRTGIVQPSCLVLDSFPDLNRLELRKGPSRKDDIDDEGRLSCGSGKNRSETGT